MFAYIARRLVTSLLVLLGASFIIYLLIAYSGDPLKDLRASNAPNKAQLMAARVDALDLDTTPVLRYFHWLRGASGCLVGHCDLGQTLDREPVTQALGHAIPSTLQLLGAATVIAIVFGIFVGVVTALRQYSAFDYSVTFVSFLFFSLPLFWVAVLLKEFVAIKFNDFLASATISPRNLAIIAIGSGLIWVLIIGGSWRRRGITFLAAALITLAVFTYISATQWLQTPRLGPVVIALTGAAIAYGSASLFAGPRNKRTLYAAGTTALVGVIAFFVLNYVPVSGGYSLFNSTGFGFWWLVGLLVLALLIGILIGRLFGGDDWRQSSKAGALTAFGMGCLITLDRFMQTWPVYSTSPWVPQTRTGDDHWGRPIGTIGANIPGLEGSFWLHGVDKFSHLLLPTLALLLISLAGYTRYSRASMLEVLGQDYIRTARAKGVPERLVISRHAFRNALMPLATVVAFDLGALIGGAVITEYVFSIQGMGQLFIQGIYHTDPNPVMGAAIVSGITAVLANFLADLAYSVLDPRVRVK